MHVNKSLNGTKFFMKNLKNDGNAFYYYLVKLKSVFVKICRQYSLKDFSDLINELNCFSDVSKRYYAFVIYLRFLHKFGKVEVSIVMRKSPLLTVKNNMTIPRGELNALLLICELVTSVVNVLKPVYIFNSIYFWSDSSIAFCWVKNDSKIRKPYVQKRLNKIREVIKDFSCLKLIPSK